MRDNWKEFLKGANLKEFPGVNWLNAKFLSVLSVEEIQNLLNSGGLKANQSELRQGKLQIDQKQQIFPISQSRNQDRQNCWALSTGSTNLDACLDGDFRKEQGIPSGQITLFYGKFRTGKSQICHQLLVNAYHQLYETPPEYVGIFIDTEGTFRPERINDMASRYSLPPNDILTRIYVSRVQSIPDMTLILQKIDQLLTQSQIRILVIDSLTNLFRHEIAKKEMELSQIIASFSTMLQTLSQWAALYNIPVVVTSQVTSAMQDIYFFEVIPILGTTMGKFIKQWVLLGETEQSSAIPEKIGRRYAHLINGQTCPEVIAQFIITKKGIEDVFIFS